MTEETECMVLELLRRMRHVAGHVGCLQVRLHKRRFETPVKAIVGGVPLGILPHPAIVMLGGVMRVGPIGHIVSENAGIIKNALLNPRAHRGIGRNTPQAKINT